MYNGYEASEEPDLYNVIWTVARGADGTISNLMLKDNNENYGDKLVTSSDEYISTEGIVKNKGIYFFFFTMKGLLAASLISLHT